MVAEKARTARGGHGVLAEVGAAVFEVGVQVEDQGEAALFVDGAGVGTVAMPIEKLADAAAVEAVALIAAGSLGDANGFWGVGAPSFQMLSASS